MGKDIYNCRVMRRQPRLGISFAEAAMLVKSKCFKCFLISALSVITCIVLFIAFMNLTQARKLNGIIDSISDYYYISCPNGNVLDISAAGNLKFDYNLIKYSHTLTEDSGRISYRSVTDILGKTKFMHIGLLTGPSGMNDRTDFPQCVIEVNDSSKEQRFFYKSVDGDQIKTPGADGGKIYISFQHSIAYDQTRELFSELDRYGNVAWLWVDTYGQSDMDHNPVTLQNPLENNELPLYGIPIYHNGEYVENPLEAFLEILNKSDENTDNPISSKIYNIKLGINASGGKLCENDIKIIGAVLLPSNDMDRKQILNDLNNMYNIKCCT